MLTSAGFPIDSIDNLKRNTFWDGVFHASTYVFVFVGVFLLWRAARRVHLIWSTKLIIGSLLIGFGAFNLVEGIIDHHLLGLHHVNETVPREQWIYWDAGFLASGAVLVLTGALLLKAGRRETARAAIAASTKRAGPLHLQGIRDPRI